MFSMLRTTLSKLPSVFSKIPISNQSVALFHVLLKPNIVNLNNLIIKNTESRILCPSNFNIVPTCGFKVKGWLRRRCKDCFFVVRQQRLYVICKTHPRHKQMSMVPKEKNTWILTHATQGKIRPW